MGAVECVSPVIDEGVQRYGDGARASIGQR